MGLFPRLFVTPSGNPDVNKNETQKKQKKEQGTQNTPTTNKFVWEIKAQSSYTTSNPDINNIVKNFGYPIKDKAEVYIDLADRINFDVGSNRKGQLSADTQRDIKLMLDANKDLHFSFNDILGKPWSESINNYSGNKGMIPLYTLTRSKLTESLKSTLFGNSNLDEILKEVSNRPPEVHHFKFKAIFSQLANQPTNLLLVQRSEREKEFGPGQHELFHMVASGNNKDKFRVFLPKVGDAYDSWLKTEGVVNLFTLNKK